MNLSSDAILSRMLAQQHLVDMSANNVANANTHGFKSQEFRATTWGLPMRTPVAIAEEAAIALSSTDNGYRDDAPGPLEQTSSPFDLAIQGGAYFEVQTPQGRRLTRDGHFMLSPNGNLTDGAGDLLLDTAGQPLLAPPGRGTLTVAADGAASVGAILVGKIGLVEPVDPATLTPLSGALFQTDGAVRPAQGSHVIQGALEQSNVQPVIELTRLMSALREFQLAANYQQAESDRVQKTIDQLVKES